MPTEHWLYTIPLRSRQVARARLQMASDSLGNFDAPIL